MQCQFVARKQSILIQDVVSLDGQIIGSDVVRGDVILVKALCVKRIKSRQEPEVEGR